LHPGPSSAGLEEAGNPAAQVRISLIHNGELLADTRTNSDGRCDSPLLVAAAWKPPKPPTAPSAASFPAQIPKPRHPC
jgi:hypothetical protein